MMFVDCAEEKGERDRERKRKSENEKERRGVFNILQPSTYKYP